MQRQPQAHNSRESEVVYVLWRPFVVDQSAIEMPFCMQHRLAELADHHQHRVGGKWGRSRWQTRVEGFCL